MRNLLSSQEALVHSLGKSSASNCASNTSKVDTQDKDLPQNDQYLQRLRGWPRHYQV